MAHDWYILVYIYHCFAPQHARERLRHTTHVAGLPAEGWTAG